LRSFEKENAIIVILILNYKYFRKNIFFSHLMLRFTFLNLKHLLFFSFYFSYYLLQFSRYSHYFNLIYFLKSYRIKLELKYKFNFKVKFY